MVPRLSASSPRPSEEIASEYRRQILNPDATVSLTPLHRRGGVDEFELARNYCESTDELDRLTGADILGQIGFEEGGTFVDESLDLLIPLLKDRSDDVAMGAAIALGHRNDARAIPHLLALMDHPDADVRYGLVHGLMRHEEPTAIEATIQLTRDPDGDVRNWALFSLATQVEDDSEAVRDALATGLSDPRHEARGEAMVGLARRSDPRVFDAILDEWETDTVSILSIQAAEALADPRLVPDLEALRSDTPDEDEFAAPIDAALRACRAD